MDCHYEGCNLDAALRCKCSNPPVFYCNYHITLHLKQEGKHNIKSNYIEISKQAALMLTLSFQRCLEKCRILKENLIKEGNFAIQKLISNVNAACCQLREHEIIYIKALEFLQDEKPIKKHSNFSDVEELIIRYKRNQDLIDDDILNIQKEADIFNVITLVDPKLLQEKDIQISRLLEEIKVSSSKEKILKDCLKTTYPNASEFIEDILAKHDMKHIYYFENNTKKLVTVNALENIDSFEIINIPDNLFQSSAYCYLPSNKLFCYGGKGNEETNMLFILNTDNKQIEYLERRMKKYDMATCFISDSVYIIGGYTGGNSIKEVEKFNIIDKK